MICQVFRPRYPSMVRYKSNLVLKMHSSTRISLLCQAPSRVTLLYKYPHLCLNPREIQMFCRQQISKRHQLINQIMNLSSLLKPHHHPIDHQQGRVKTSNNQVQILKQLRIPEGARGSEGHVRAARPRPRRRTPYPHSTTQSQTPINQTVTRRLVHSAWMTATTS